MELEEKYSAAVAAEEAGQAADQRDQLLARSFLAPLTRLSSTASLLPSPLSLSLRATYQAPLVGPPALLTREAPSRRLPPQAAKKKLEEVMRAKFAAASAAGDHEGALRFLRLYPKVRPRATRPRHPLRHHFKCVSETDPSLRPVRPSIAGHVRGGPRRVLPVPALCDRHAGARGLRGSGGHVRNGHQPSPASVHSSLFRAHHPRAAQPTSSGCRSSP